MTSRMSSNVETIIPPSLQSFALCRLLLPARSRRAVLLIASFIFSPSPSLSLFFPSPSPPLSSSSINSIISLLTVVCLSLPFLLTFFFFFFLSSLRVSCGPTNGGLRSLLHPSLFLSFDCIILSNNWPTIFICLSYLLYLSFCSLLHGARWALAAPPSSERVIVSAHHHHFLPARTPHNTATTCLVFCCSGGALSICLHRLLL